MNVTFWQTCYMPYGVGDNNMFQFAGILTFEDGTHERVYTDGDRYIDQLKCEPVEVDYVEFEGSD